MTARNIKLVLRYDGTEFAGWQYQPRQRTVQGEVQAAIRKLTGKTVTLYAAGRTDAGVHALGQVVNFTTDSPLPVKKYRDGLNFYLPDDILVHTAEEAPESFHARYGAIYRHYRYLIDSDRSPLHRKRRWEVGHELDLGALKAAADHIRGEHDFSTFCVVSSRLKDNRCLVYESCWRAEDALWTYEIIGNRFLHTMVRSLVGLMIEVGRGALTMRQFKSIFVSGDHTAVTHVAPARGLCLVAVGYEKEL